MKMSQTVSNLSYSLHIPSGKTSNPCDKNKYMYLVKCVGRRNPIKAMAIRGSDNLNPLHKPSHTTHSLPHPNKRVAPEGLWDRFPTSKTVQQMMEQMERMMEDPFEYSGGWPSPVPREGSGYNSRGRTPWEVKEGENEYKMRFDMPGMTKEDVKVCVDEAKMLVIKAEKVPKKKSEDGDWSAKSYGRYSSRIVLPENVEFEKIKAEVKDGILYVTIPKASSSAKVFDINVE